MDCGQSELVVVRVNGSRGKLVGGELGEWVMGRVIGRAGRFLLNTSRLVLLNTQMCLTLCYLIFCMLPC